MFACVIPVAPDFQDPLAAANIPPYLHDPTPPFNSTVSIISTTSSVPHYTFTSQVTDPNVNDTLLVRWILNYPPSSGTTTVSFDSPSSGPPATGTSHNYETTFDMYCGRVSGIASGVPQHLSLVVSDRPWQMPGQLGDAVGTTPAQNDWTLIFQCAEGTP